MTTIAWYDHGNVTHAYRLGNWVSLCGLKVHGQAASLSPFPTTSPHCRTCEKIVARQKDQEFPAQSGNRTA